MNLNQEAIEMASPSNSKQVKEISNPLRDAPEVSAAALQKGEATQANGKRLTLNGKKVKQIPNFALLQNHNVKSNGRESLNTD